MPIRKNKTVSAVSRDLESPAAIAVVDDILAGVGLSHGRRATRSDTWTGGERRPVGRKKDAAERAAARPAQKPKPIRSKLLSAEAALCHGFSTRAGGVSRCYRTGLPPGMGDLNLGFTTHDEPASVAKNRELFLRSLRGDNFKQFGLLRQVHSPIIRTIDTAEEASTTLTQPATWRGDGLMTDVPGVLLTVQIADCVPLLLFDPRCRAVAALHAGWRGTLARMAERAVGTMRLRYGTDPADVLAVVGPSIGPASYAVSEEIRHDFESQFAYASDLFTSVYESDPIREKYPLLFLTARAPGHSPIGPQLHLDLWEANRRQLLDAGLVAEHIDVLGQDTAADTGRFFSHRAEDGFTGRMMAAIGMQA